MTADQIERQVERMMDHLDHRFMHSAMTQEEYSAEVKKLNQWAEHQYDSPFSRIATKESAP